MCCFPLLSFVCQANDDVTIDHKMRARKGGVKQYKQTNNNNKTTTKQANKGFSVGGARPELFCVVVGNYCMWL